MGQFHSVLHRNYNYFSASVSAVWSTEAQTNNEVRWRSRLSILELKINRATASIHDRGSNHLHTYGIQSAMRSRSHMPNSRWDKSDQSEDSNTNCIRSAFALFMRKREFLCVWFRDEFLKWINPVQMCVPAAGRIAYYSTCVYCCSHWMRD